ncbi:MAG TPA: 3-dehydroquinate synthase [Candidatus Acidoferrum sp.]|jgi:3-dehydroquinate synthase
MPKHLIPIKSARGNYSVVCGFGILRTASAEIHKLGTFSSLHVVSSSHVWRALGKTVEHAFGKARITAVHLIDDAESAKNIRTIEKLCQTLATRRADRKALIVAVGGGVIGDVAGFAAASYLRGVALVHVPTTVVAQIDSSIGGKTGVNLSAGKNLVGAFYPPRLILTDPDLLRTLPDAEFRSGLAEIIKHAIIADTSMLAYLEKNMDKILRRDPATLEYLIPRNIQIKARVVSRDERESSLREILNFGHTFAHALESLTKYRRYRHGEAVAWGMMAAARLGHEAGITTAVDLSRIAALVRRLGVLPPWPNVSPAKLIDAMRADKKTRNGKLRFVLIPRLGRAASYDSIPRSAIERVLRLAPDFLAAAGKRNG